MKVDLEEYHKLKQYAFNATVAITGLTVGGSEYFAGKIGDIYVADLDFCVKKVRERFDDGFEAEKRFWRLRKFLQEHHPDVWEEYQVG